MRTIWLVFRSVVIATCLLLSFSTRVHAQIAHPIIGEVAWAGSSLSSADEWLELWNPTANTTTLAGYKLRGASPNDISFGDADAIPPYSAFLIANYAMGDEKSVLDASPQIVTTTVSLSNSALKIELITPDDAIIDTAGDDGAPPAGASLPEKMSMIRNLDGTWFSTATSTPGVCDGCILPEPATSTEVTIETPSSTVIANEVTQSCSQDCGASPEPVEGSAPRNDIPTSTQETVELPVSIPEPIQTAAPIIYITPLDLRLHAIFPAPESGSEWIEIDSSSATDTSQIFGWSLKDGSSTIFRFQDSTRASIIMNGSTWRITLASARLNNGGDTVELIRADGSVAERMSYPETDRGKTWIKNQDGNAWVIDPPEEITDEPEIQMTVPPMIELPTIEFLSETEPEPQKEKIIIDEPIKKKVTPTKPKTAPKPKPSVIQTTINDMHEISSGVKIRLSGTVATKPDIIGKHQFILVAPDGQGLWVRGTNKQPSPAQNTVVEVSGTLMQNDDGVYLKMSTTDIWKKKDGPPDFKPRIVDLTAQDERDSWSFVEVTGTVLEVKGQNVELDLNGVVAITRIKPATGYRAQRLLIGDTLNVRGVVDLRGDSPVILPSDAEDILLVSHAKKAALEKPKSLPDWLPFGAAGITIAVTETVKRVRKIYRERQLRLQAPASN